MARRGSVAVTLRDGRRFTDGVCEVLAACGTYVVVFYANNCVPIDDIVGCEANARGELATVA